MVLSLIKVGITGIRPREKLYEELLKAGEGPGRTGHEKILLARLTFTDMNVLKKGFDESKFIIESGSKEDLVRKIEELVPTYRSTTNNEGPLQSVQLTEQEVVVEVLLSNSESRYIVKQKITRR